MAVMPFPFVTAAIPDLPVIAVRVPNFPQYRFEWHRQTRKVYLIRLLTAPGIGDPIAEHVADHGSAINAVNTWCRGYREAQSLRNATQGEPNGQDRAKAAR